MVVDVASPVVPAVGFIMVPPPIMPPDMLPMVIVLVPIIPFIAPSDESSIMAVTIADEEVIPISFAYSDMAAMAMP